MKQYVLGFAFNEDASHVVLIQKTKPEWQKNLYNGVGGKIEPGERPIDAMVREFYEETGVETKEEDWNYYCEMGGGFKCYVYVMKSSAVYKVKTTTEEKVSVLPVDAIYALPLISNLRWLVPAAIDSQREPKFTLETSYFAEC